MAASRKQDIRSKTLAMLALEYDLTTGIARDLATSIADNFALRAACDARVKKDGIICRAGRNGAPYAHPAISIRQKTLELVERQIKRLERYRLAKKAEPLTLDDDEASR